MKELGCSPCGVALFLSGSKKRLEKSNFGRFDHISAQTLIFDVPSMAKFKIPTQKGVFFFKSVKVCNVLIFFGFISRFLLSSA